MATRKIWKGACGTQVKFLKVLRYCSTIRNYKGALFDNLYSVFLHISLIRSIQNLDNLDHSKIHVIVILIPLYSMYSMVLGWFFKGLYLNAWPYLEIAFHLHKKLNNYIIIIIK